MKCLNGLTVDSQERAHDEVGVVVWLDHLLTMRWLSSIWPSDIVAVLGLAAIGHGGVDLSHRDVARLEVAALELLVCRLHILLDAGPAGSLLTAVVVKAGEVNLLARPQLPIQPLPIDQEEALEVVDGLAEPARSASALELDTRVSSSGHAGKLGCGAIGISS